MNETRDTCLDSHALEVASSFGQRPKLSKQLEAAANRVDAKLRLSEVAQYIGRLNLMYANIYIMYPIYLFLYTLSYIGLSFLWRMLIISAD